MQFHDDEADDRRCAGIEGEPRCKKERQQLKPQCEECEKESRLRALEAKFAPFTKADEIKNRRRNEKAAETKRKKKEGAASVANDSAEPKTVAAKPPPVAATPSLPPAAVTNPVPAKTIPFKPFNKCRSPSCFYQAEGDHPLCKGCNSQFRIWHRYTIENKALPIVLADDVIACYKLIAQQSAI